MTTHIVTSLRVAAMIGSIVRLAPPVPTLFDAGGVAHETRAVQSSSSSATPAPAISPELRRDREFHPDYSHALSVEQMTAAWNAEIDRLFPVPIAGGG